MNISTREIQILVGGVFAYIGLRAFIGLPFYFIAPLDFDSIVVAITVGLALPIGVGMLKGNLRAILFARIFLWLIIASSFISVPIHMHVVHANIILVLQRTVPDLVTSIILLMLLHWTVVNAPTAK